MSLKITISPNARLERLLCSDQTFEKVVRSIISKELVKARSELAKDAKSAVPNDPRQAYKAVRRGVYKRILGGQLNILAQKKAGTPHEYIKRRKLDRNPHQRGGNRMPRSERTKKLDSYWGKDRGFILRFLNDGADRTGNTPNRGRIAARNWFGGASQKEMEAASERIARLIDEEIKKLTT